MANVVTFEDYVPLARHDNKAWTQAQIQEAPDVNGEPGLFVILETKALNPLDADPSQPMPRNFTTELATAPDGLWYRIVWVDLTGDISETEPVFNFALPTLEYTPSFSQVGAVTLSRTRDSVGAILGTFTQATHPKATQVQVLIRNAVDDLREKIGTDIPDHLIGRAQHLAALRTAMLIELTYFANEVAQNRSPYRQYKELYDEDIKDLILAVAAYEAGQSVTDQASGQMPAYGFPAATNWMEGRM